MRFSTIPAIVALFLGAAATVSADCLSTDGNEYPFGTFTCENGNEIVQCTASGSWTLIAQCGGTCTFEGTSPFCA